MRPLVIALFGLAVTAFADPLEFKGEFSQIKTEGAPCEKVFEPSAYDTKLYFVGPTSRTVVIHFTGAPKEAFFQGINLVGRIGGSNDVLVERTFSKDGYTFDVRAEGIVNNELLILGVIVSAKTASGFPICRGEAEYSGFN